ncbi:MAG: F0F1 ATP synthase subunit delta [Lacisediminimonas sp.]|nr:F0F1 ATP synthase subunit delta [Lacisediminimonas sp.]
MAELATVARPYAEALFRVAVTGNLQAWSQLVSEMADVASVPETKLMADNPRLTTEQTTEIFLATLQSPVTAEAKNFVMMLVQNGRLTLLPEIGAQFQRLKNAQEGAADAQIVSAFALTPAQVQDLVAVLESKFSRKLNPSVTVDSSLIGGVRVVVGDQVLDTSVRAKLQKMHVALAA